MDNLEVCKDDRPSQPLEARYDQKIAKYGRIADGNTLPAIFSHTGQQVNSEYQSQSVGQNPLRQKSGFDKVMGPALFQVPGGTTSLTDCSAAIAGKFFPLTTPRVE